MIDFSKQLWGRKMHAEPLADFSPSEPLEQKKLDVDNEGCATYKSNQRL